MGSIDLDPFSSFAANKRVSALNFFTEDDSGLAQGWFGNIWMNHPFSGGEHPCKPSCKKKRCDPSYMHQRKKPSHWRGYCIDYYVPSNADYINKMMNEFKRGNYKQSCNITYNPSSETWFRPLLDYPQCILYPRTDYYTPDGKKKKGVTKGSVVTYLGDNVDKFKKVFEIELKLGKVKI